MPSFFDKKIKADNPIRTDNPTQKLNRVLSLCPSDTETGVNTGRTNIFGKQ